jgi:molybdopterin synthase sulfur carrier subunit
MTGKVPVPTIEMKVSIFTFAQTRTQLGFAEKTLDCEPTESPRQIFQRIAPQFNPGKTIRVAVNQEYADWDKPIGNAIEIALIPPVSGG